MGRNPTVWSKLCYSISVISVAMFSFISQKVFITRGVKIPIWSLQNNLKSPLQVQRNLNQSEAIWSKNFLLPQIYHYESSWWLKLIMNTVCKFGLNFWEPSKLTTTSPNVPSKTSSNLSPFGIEFSIPPKIYHYGSKQTIKSITRYTKLSWSENIKYCPQINHYKWKWTIKIHCKYDWPHLV